MSYNHLELYTRKILKAESNQELERLGKQIQESDLIDEYEKEQLMGILTNKLVDLNNEIKVPTVQAPKGYIQYGDYDTDMSDDLEPCTNLWQDSTYLSFMENEFFGRFIHLPYLEQQKKLMLTLLFINSKACGNTIPLPHFYFLSNKPNSGKTTMAKFIGNHYTNGSFVYIAEDTPGGTLRNIFSEANEFQNPTYCLLDNFHPQKTVDRLGAFYGRLLKYTSEESFCKVSQGMGKDMLEFNTFSLKVFTSIFPLDRKTEELKSRCFTLMFESAPNTLEDLDEYNWQPLQDEYFSVWGDTKKTSAKIRSVMRSLTKQKSDKIKNRQWQLTRYLIAVGVMVGIHRNIQDAIKYFEDYFDWFNALDLKGSRNSLQLAVDEYVTSIHPKRVDKDNRLYGAESFLKLNEIQYSDLFRFLSKNIPINKNLTTEYQITAVLEQYGWKMEIIRDLHGDRIDLIYRLE